ncbi:MAG TPA: hypothetical protein VFO41_08280 [Alphaproteobacteria bacterium]|nr:hypothetical protein [Alphaproteobacteria bacterium]
MRKFTFLTAALMGVALLSGSANACSETGPRYIGVRSADPEKETYGYVVKPGKQQLISFVGPARHFGAVTGDMEKDTVAYRLLLVPTSSKLEASRAHKYPGQ